MVMRERNSNGKILATLWLMIAGKTAMHRAQNPMMIQKRLKTKIAYSVARKIAITAAHDMAICIPKRCIFFNYAIHLLK